MEVHKLDNFHAEQEDKLVPIKTEGFTENKESAPPQNVIIKVNKENKDYVVRSASPDNSMYVQWGIELHKGGIEFANGYLRHLLTLDVAVIGVYVTLVDKKMVDPNYGKLILGLFFLSLFVSFIGSLPTQKKINFRNPEQVKKMTEKTYFFKKVCIWLSSITFFVGLLALSKGLNFF